MDGHRAVPSVPVYTVKERDGRREKYRRLRSRGKEVSHADFIRGFGLSSPVQSSSATSSSCDENESKNINDLFNGTSDCCVYIYSFVY